MFAVVTDSSIDLSLEQLQALGVYLVPLDVHFGETTYVDAYELSPADFYEKMDAYLPALPKTNCPTAGAFAKAYRQAVADGADGIVVATISSGISGTYNSCVVAAETCADLDVPIRCIDSKETAGCLSFLIEKACRMRDASASVEEAAEVLGQMVQACDFYIGMETIEYVIAGGRLNEESGGMEGTDSGLTIKGVLTLRKSDGKVDLVAKPRGIKAQQREVVRFIEDYVAQHPGAAVRFSHANATERCDKVKELLDEKGIAYSSAEPGWLAGLLGVYVGNHSYAVSLMPSELL